MTQTSQQIFEKNIFKMNKLRRKSNACGSEEREREREREGLSKFDGLDVMVVDLMTNIMSSENY
jgi:hypothetical protein